MEIPQLRQDLVSGDWIVIAPGRGKRPDQLATHERRKRAPIRGCLFEKPHELDHVEPSIQVADRNGWRLVVIPNKYPAFVHRDVCSVIGTKGPYTVTDGIGYQDVVITRDHDADFPDLDKKAANEVFKAFQDRYLMLMNDECLAYATMFHNWGPRAGASIYHPHYQMAAIPVTPPDFEHSLRGSEEYYKKHGECVHCAMISWERKEKKRVLFENETAIAFAPFVSRSAFEIRVFPKHHLPFFENTGQREMSDMVLILQKVLRMMKVRLADPDYIFFIHTAPMRNKERLKSYHWHIEVLPKINIRGGFELGTGIEINSVDPDLAARILKGRA